MKNKTLGKLVIIFSLLAIAIALYCLASSELEDNVIWKNVEINGISIQGLTKKEAAERLTADFNEKYADMALTVRYEDKDYRIKIYPTLGFDAEKEIDKAYQLGHSKWYLRGLEWVGKHIINRKTETVTVYPHAASPEKVEDAISESGFPMTDKDVESTYEVTDTSIVIHKGQKKNIADIDQLDKLIIAAIDDNDYESIIDCPLSEQVPGDIDFQKIYDDVYKKKKNASLNKKTMEISASQSGVSFDVDSAKKKYEACGYGENLTIDFKITAPNVTTEDLKNNLFNTTLASYSTQGGGSEGRKTNIGLAVKSCNNVILLPGETFSYNDTLGERTADRGYKAANAYSDGEVVEQLGGGICQVSSTLFSALLYTDLEIVVRSNHSMPVSYLPMGMDAAVSWGAPDLKFKNNFDYPIKISASYSGGTISFKILGAKADDKEIDVKVEKTGEMSAKTYRKYYTNGKLTSTKLICSSKYKPLKSD